MLNHLQAIIEGIQKLRVKDLILRAVLICLHLDLLY